MIAYRLQGLIPGVRLRFELINCNPKGGAAMVSQSPGLDNFLLLLGHSQRSFRVRGTPLGDWGLGLLRMDVGLSIAGRIRGCATAATVTRRSILSEPWKVNDYYASTKIGAFDGCDHARWRWGV